MNAPTETELLKKSDVCELLNISARCLEYMVKEARFPPPVRVGRFNYWSAKAIDRWRVRCFGAQENWAP
jgi:predicted DNA-binding transcriptional regulator AlpA